MGILGMSLPSWERGLKYCVYGECGWTGVSLPSWERGLKSYSCLDQLSAVGVASLVGAWIENPKYPKETGQMSGSLPSWERGLKSSDQVHLARAC